MIDTHDCIIESDINDNKKKLRESINKRNLFNENEIQNLQRLLTFVELPSLNKDVSKV